MSEIKAEILEYIKDEYLDDEEEEIGYDTPLISGGIVDSFSMVSLKRYLENKFQIKIPDAKASADTFDSVNKIVGLLDELKS